MLHFQCWTISSVWAWTSWGIVCELQQVFLRPQLWIFVAHQSFCAENRHLRHQSVIFVTKHVSTGCERQTNEIHEAEFFLKDTNSLSVGQAVCRILEEPPFHYRVYRSQPLVPAESQIVTVFTGANHWSLQRARSLPCLQESTTGPCREPDRYRVYRSQPLVPAESHINP